MKETATEAALLGLLCIDVQDVMLIPLDVAHHSGIISPTVPI
jgi:hypothetical protein